MAVTRGNAASAADIDGFIRNALEPLEYEEVEPHEIQPIEERDRYGNTEVGSSSVARALIAIRDRLRADADEQNAIPTAPPPPNSDIRRIGSTIEDPDEDPLAVYVDALRPPAVEIDIEPRTLAPLRARRQTLQMSTRPRQPTLVMIDRPVPSPPIATSTPQPSPTAVATVTVPRPKARSSSAGVSFPLLLLAFAVGILLSGVAVFALNHV